MLSAARTFERTVGVRAGMWGLHDALWRAKALDASGGGGSTKSRLSSRPSTFEMSADPVGGSTRLRPGFTVRLRAGSPIRRRPVGERLGGWGRDAGVNTKCSRPLCPCPRRDSFEIGLEAGAQTASGPTRAIGTGLSFLRSEESTWREGRDAGAQPSSPRLALAIGTRLCNLRCATSCCIDGIETSFGGIAGARMLVSTSKALAWLASRATRYSFFIVLASKVVAAA
mmetsp:Transcript_7247/g.22390  ORF Transcript_7247/g.22390 Transcript_7247/m.22390 type:complete len:227 (+) Transcript_7247:1191-1871(+)